MTTDPRAELDEVKARLDAATPGPWSWGEDTRRAYPVETVCRIGSNTTGQDAAFTTAYHTADAELIAHAPADLAKLVAAVESVLALHVVVYPDPASDPWYDAGECKPWCKACGRIYPCPTVEAVTDALGGE